jgi:hypothetical protein
MEKKGNITISRRLANGWSTKVVNKDPEKCDLDGAKLWIGPGDQVYCDLVHDVGPGNPVDDGRPKKE